MSTQTHNHSPSLFSPRKFSFDLFYPLRRWVDNIEVNNEKFAHFLCNLIPCSCPFERDVTIFGRNFHLPALCKLNPLYNETVALRLRALTYLEGDCEEDITKYIC
ncbi:MAG: Mo-dependent nitrogenase C-terminal domain-containing protein [Xenococcus sp. MO_188.B8]|nr:Mo-dependent nitrogenase C-terminal domain-containing protein [Xenococcus sp. MO_188.B8]